MVLLYILGVFYILFNFQRFLFSAYPEDDNCNVVERSTY